jgi:hypothetical protein
MICAGSATPAPNHSPGDRSQAGDAQRQTPPSTRDSAAELEFAAQKGVVFYA